MERTTRLLALFLTSIAMSAAACGGSTPSATAPAATAATSPQQSVQASAAPTSASPSAAATSPSVAPTTKVNWTFGGSLPSGWTEDEGTFSRSEKAYVEVLTDRSLMATNCALGPQPGIGHTAADIVGALSRRPGLATTGANDITVAGFAGRQIDFALAPGWRSCDWWGDPTAPVVPLIGTFDDKNFWLYNAITKGEQYRYLVLDTPGGGNVVIAITAVDPERLQEVAGPAMSIVHGLQYHIRN